MTEQVTLDTSKEHQLLQKVACFDSDWIWGYIASEQRREEVKVVLKEIFSKEGVTQKEKKTFLERICDALIEYALSSQNYNTVFTKAEAFWADVPLIYGAMRDLWNSLGLNPIDVHYVMGKRFVAVQERIAELETGQH